MAGSSKALRHQRPQIIFFHGNTGNIFDVGWLGEQFHERGFDVLLFDYRGYGASEGDAENERVCMPTAMPRWRSSLIRKVCLRIRLFCMVSRSGLRSWYVASRRDQVEL